MTKDQYIEAINSILQERNDLSLHDLILQILVKS